MGKERLDAPEWEWDLTSPMTRTLEEGWESHARWKLTRRLVQSAVHALSQRTQPIGNTADKATACFGPLKCRFLLCDLVGLVGSAADCLLARGGKSKKKKVSEG